MSSSTTSGVTREPAVADGFESRIPFLRLVAVEVRKSVDTRASRAVLGAFLGVGLLILAFTVAIDPEATMASAFLPALLVIPAFPVVGALIMTSEWSQRTALTTFRFEPRRIRVLFAKLVASLGVTAVIVVGIVLTCAVVTAVILTIRGQALEAADLGGWLRAVLASALLMSLFGVAWGALLTVTPVAILFTVVMTLIGDLVISYAAGEADVWFRMSTPMNWLASMPGEEPSEFVGGVVTGFLIWYVVPLAAGFWFQVRREVR